jgi:hypothetical protein
MKFITDWAVRGNIDVYKSEIERDWAYIVRREYRFGVTYRSWGDAIAVSSLAQTAATFYNKRITWWPMLLIPVITAMRVPSNFRRNNRRYFEMLNIGSEYELGAERNRVLEECNHLTQRTDF